MELNQPHLIREQKVLTSQNQSDSTIALTAPNYVSH